MNIELNEENIKNKRDAFYKVTRETRAKAKNKSSTMASKLYKTVGYTLQGGIDFKNQKVNLSGEVK